MGIEHSIIGQTAEIKTLNIAPMKALGLLSLEAARLGKYGLETLDGFLRDRAAMICIEKPDGTLARISQRDTGDLALVRPTYNEQDQELIYTAPGMKSLHVIPTELMPHLGVPHPITFDRAEIGRGVTEEGQITEWIKEYLSKQGCSEDKARKLKIVFPHAEFFERAVDEMHQASADSKTLFGDGGKVTIASNETLSHLNDALEVGEGPIDMNAFRMNIIIEGLDASAENLVKSIEIAGIRDNGATKVKMLIGGLCVRCPVTTVNQNTGKKGKQPLKWLLANSPRRPDKPNLPTFGLNADYLSCEEGSEIRVGDKLIVTEER